MCFFDMHRFACGDWKWGNFRQHCAKEYRMGETCGMKLIMQTIHAPNKCRICEKIDTKRRRQNAELDRVHRWQREGSKFSASIDKSMESIKVLEQEIRLLVADKERRQGNLGGTSAP